MSAPATIRPGPEINEEIAAAELSLTINARPESYGSEWPTSTYEEGVIAALKWVTGDSPLAPMTEEATS